MKRRSFLKGLAGATAIAMVPLGMMVGKKTGISNKDAVKAKEKLESVVTTPDYGINAYNHNGTIYVDSEATGANTGLSMDDAFVNITDAVNVAGAGSTIFIQGTQTINHIELKGGTAGKPITYVGGSLKSNTYVCGNNTTWINTCFESQNITPLYANKTTRAYNSVFKGKKKNHYLKQVRI